MTNSNVDTCNCKQLFSVVYCRELYFTGSMNLFFIFNGGELLLRPVWSFRNKLSCAQQKGLPPSDCQLTANSPAESRCAGRSLIASQGGTCRGCSLIQEGFFKCGLMANLVYKSRSFVCSTGRAFLGGESSS